MISLRAQRRGLLVVLDGVGTCTRLSTRDDAHEPDGGVAGIDIGVPLGARVDRVLAGCQARGALVAIDLQEPFGDDDQLVPPDGIRLGVVPLAHAQCPHPQLRFFCGRRRAQEGSRAVGGVPRHLVDRPPGALGGASCLIQITMNWAQRSVSPTRATIIYAGEPVWAGIIGRIAGERLAPVAILGAVFIVVGSLVSELRPRNSSVDDPHTEETAEVR